MMMVYFVAYILAMPVTVFISAVVLKRLGEKCDNGDFAVICFASMVWPLVWLAAIAYGLFRAGVRLGTPKPPKPEAPPRPAFYADDRPNVRIVLPATGSYRTRMIVTAKGLAFNGQELVDDLKTKITVEEE